MKKILFFCAAFFLAQVFSFSQSVTINGPASACQGTSVTFTTIVTGVVPITYQWKKDNANIPFATGSGYVINYVTLSDSGSYTLTISYDLSGTTEYLTSPPHVFSVDSLHTIVLTSGMQNQSVCNGNALITTVYTFGGGADSASVASLPPGLNSNISGKTLIISGIPTANGTYTVTTSGNSCQSATISGTITMTPQPLLSLQSGLQNQSVCAGTSITATIYAYGNSATAVIVNNLPAGLTSNIDTSNKTLTITGSPLQSGVYTVSTVSPCTDVSLNGSVEIIAPISLSKIDGDNSVCSNQQGVVYRIDSVSNINNYSWSVTGGTIVGGNGTTKISVNWGLVSMSGSVMVSVNDANNCPSVQSLIVTVSQLSAYNLNDIIARYNAPGEPFMLLYPNPPQEMYYQWYNNDVKIDGANEQFYYPPLVTPGTLLEPNTDYKVYVALASNRDCGNFTKAYHFSKAGKDAFVIAPNPNDGKFVVGFGSEISNLAGSFLEIISLDGKVIRMTVVNDKGNMKMNLNLQNGFYFIKLTTGQGEIFVKSFIVR